MDPTRPKRGHERRVAEVRKSSTRSIHVHRPSFGSGSMFLQCSAPNTCIILKNFVPSCATENRVHVSVPSWLKVSSAPLESFFGAARPGTETVPPNPSGAFAPLIQMSDTQTQKLETVEALLQPHDTLLIFFLVLSVRTWQGQSVSPRRRLRLRTLPRGRFAVKTRIHVRSCSFHLKPV